ncbi:MAG: hypothetical protein H0T62_11950 [Parachlamydiaceae bacterium]|nr:hypothetical protein [Parachlamydiaceae bacterium]
MNCAHIFLFTFLLLASAFTKAQLPSENPECGHIEEQRHFIDSYLKDLEGLGYCIIPKLLSTSETETLYKRVWNEFIEKAWPNCKLDNRSNWKETFPRHNTYGLFAGPAGQIQVIWDLRQNPLIVDVFAKVWNTSDLIVSMDGLSLMCPCEIREATFASWPHVDQLISSGHNIETHGQNAHIDFVSESLLKTKPYTIQGQFLFEDSFDGDGGFYCIPKSHLRFAEFAPHLESISQLELPQVEKWKIQNSYLQDFFRRETDESGNLYSMKHITAPRGSLILWDSRTVHWNQSSSRGRPYSDKPKVRMVCYICYVPKARLTDKARAIRKEAFEKGICTNHDPADPVLKYTKDNLQQEYEQYVEDPSYIKPKIKLTSLGESLLAL